jgi:hypothetical protein
LFLANFHAAQCKGRTLRTGWEWSIAEAEIAPAPASKPFVAMLKSTPPRRPFYRKISMPRAFATLFRLFSIPAISLLCIALLIATSSRFSNFGFWCAISIPILALIVWKMMVRIKSSEMDLMECLADHSKFKKLQPYAKVFMVIYFGFYFGSFAYVGLATFFGWPLPGALIVLLIAVFSIRLELWLQTIRYSILNDIEY